MELARDLVARARSGDREAQAAFVAIYRDRVYAVCLALAGSDGEDCAQDTLVAALAGLRRFDPDAPGRLLGYSWEERCLQKVAASFGLPPLPPTLWSVAFMLAPPSSPSGGSEWLDPGHAGEDLLAPVRTPLEACVHGARVPHTQQAKAVFEPGGANRKDHALARVRIVLDDRATGEMIKCVSRVARDIAVPALPEPVDYIMLALTLPP
jgi:Sigma-70 region 2